MGRLGLLYSKKQKCPRGRYKILGLPNNINSTTLANNINNSTFEDGSKEIHSRAMDNWWKKKQ